MSRSLTVVLGMRSGTSLITRSLLEFGINLGTNLMPGDKYNMKGYFEDIELNMILEDMLTILNRKWDNVSPIAASEFEKLQHTKAQLRFINWLNNIQGNFGIKNPRLSLFLPLLTQATTMIGIPTKYLVVSRNPLSVAKSLWHRDRIQLFAGNLVWTNYMFGAISGVQDFPYIVIDYDIFLSDYHAQLSRISSLISIKKEHNTDFKAFIDQNLRHTCYTSKDLTGQVDYITEMTWKLLSAIVADSISKEEITESIYKIKTERSAINPLLGHIDFLNNELTKMKGNIEFDDDYYLKEYPDVAEAIATGKFSCAMHHYLMFGNKEKRKSQWRVSQ